MSFSEAFTWHFDQMTSLPGNSKHRGKGDLSRCCFFATGKYFSSPNSRTYVELLPDITNRFLKRGGVMAAAPRCYWWTQWSKFFLRMWTNGQSWENRLTSGIVTPSVPPDGKTEARRNAASTGARGSSLSSEPGAQTNSGLHLLNHCHVFRLWPG